jgi:MoxR-like ATPase
VQFIPDLLSADITGSDIYHQREGESIPEEPPVTRADRTWRI